MDEYEYRQMDRDILTKLHDKRLGSEPRFTDGDYVMCEHTGGKIVYGNVVGGYDDLNDSYEVSLERTKSHIWFPAGMVSPADRLEVTVQRRGGDKVEVVIGQMIFRVEGVEEDDNTTTYDIEIMSWDGEMSSDNPIVVSINQRHAGWVEGQVSVTDYSFEEHRPKNAFKQTNPFKKVKR